MVTKIIGCGNCGDNLIQFLSSSIHPPAEYYTFYLNSNKFEEIPSPSCFVIGELETRIKKIFIKGLLYNANPCFILGGLGGSQGSPIMLDLVHVANELGIKPHLIITTPFEFEMKPRKQRAEETLAQLRLLDCHLSIISNTDIMERFHHLRKEGALPSVQQQVFDIINQRIKRITYPFP